VAALLVRSGAIVEPEWLKWEKVRADAANGRHAKYWDAPVSEVWIRAATPADCEQLSRLRKALWPESSAEEHARELASLLKERKNGTMPLAIFVAEALGGLCPPTFAPARGTRRIMPTRRFGRISRSWLAISRRWLRSYSSGRIRRGLGIRRHRGKGTGARLLEAAEEWARGHGCVEMASDTWIDHTLSQRVHEVLKFEVVDRCVHYREAL
jgi:aminoglycoside 6'-N-acetyltransferase I